MDVFIGFCLHEIGFSFHTSQWECQSSLEGCHLQFRRNLEGIQKDPRSQINASELQAALPKNHEEYI